MKCKLKLTEVGPSFWDEIGLLAKTESYQPVSNETGPANFLPCPLSEISQQGTYGSSSCHVVLNDQTAPMCIGSDPYNHRVEDHNRLYMSSYYNQSLISQSLRFKFLQKVRLRWEFLPFLGFFTAWQCLAIAVCQKPVHLKYQTTIINVAVIKWHVKRIVHLELL